MSRVLRHARVLVAAALLGGTVLTAAPPAHALGPITCRDTQLNTYQRCEITATVVPFGLGEEIVAFTCTAVTVPPLTVPQVVVVQTEVSCFLAYRGTITPVTTGTFVPSPNDTALHPLPGYTSSWGRVALVSSTDDYWVCLQASYTFLGGSPSAGFHYCSVGPV